jgi:pimeloyl-ACP methyl ester carboxylesterase
VLFELPRRRVDRIVGDLEALRAHLGRDRLDLIAHSAGGDLAELYAAAHPDRIARLALITPGTRAVGFVEDEDAWFAELQRRENEPWFATAFAAVNAWNEGDASPANQLAAMPFFYGRWDAAAQAHAAGEAGEVTADAEAIYYADGMPDPAQTAAALGQVSGEVLVLIGGVDPSPTVADGEALAARFPKAELVVQPGAGHFPWLDDPGAFVATLSRFLTIH